MLVLCRVLQSLYQQVDGIQVEQTLQATVNQREKKYVRINVVSIGF